MATPLLLLASITKLLSVQNALNAAIVGKHDQHALRARIRDIKEPPSVESQASRIAPMSRMSS